MNKVFILLLGLLFSSCSFLDKKHDKIIGKDEFVGILVDLHLADATLVVQGFNVVRDSTKIEQYYDDVLKKHHITKSQLKHSMEYYSGRTEAFDKMYDKVLDELAKRGSELDKEQEKPEEPANEE